MAPHLPRAVSSTKRGFYSKVWGWCCLSTSALGIFPQGEPFPVQFFWNFAAFPNFSWRSGAIPVPGGSTIPRGWDTPRIPGKKTGFLSCCCPGWPLGPAWDRTQKLRFWGCLIPEKFSSLFPKLFLLLPGVAFPTRENVWEWLCPKAGREKGEGGLDP